MMGVSHPFHTRTHRSTSEKETTSFISSTSQSGFTAASKDRFALSASGQMSVNIIIAAAKVKSSMSVETSRESNSSFANDNEHKAEQKAKVTEAFVSEFTFMPMKTFRLREGGLVLSDYAFYRLSK